MTRILLAEDYDEIRRVIELRLRLMKFEVVAVCNGKEAFEALSREPDGFDLLITDSTMPLMRGEELAWRVRKELQSNIPIILFTADPRLELINVALAAGVNKVIPKTSELSDLKEGLFEFLGK